MLIITNIHILKNGYNKVMDFKVFVNPPSAIFSTPPRLFPGHTHDEL